MVKKINVPVCIALILSGQPASLLALLTGLHDFVFQAASFFHIYKTSLNTNPPLYFKCGGLKVICKGRACSHRCDLFSFVLVF